MVIPDISKIYGLRIESEVFGKESVDFLDNEGFVCGSINTQEPYKVWKEVRNQLETKLGTEEWERRGKELYEARIKNRARRDN